MSTRTRSRKRRALRAQRLLARVRGAVQVNERSPLIREALREAIRLEGRGRTMTGELLFEISARKYWETWGYASFRKYVEEAMPFSYRKAQQLIRVFVRWGQAGVPPDELAEIAWSKAALAAGVVHSGNVKEFMRAVESLSYAELKAKVRSMARGGSASPTDGRLSTVRFRLRKEQKEKLAVALAAAAALSGSKNDAENLDTMADGFLAANGQASQVASLPGGHHGDGSRRRPARNWQAQRPSEDEFYVDADSWDQITYAIHRGKNCLVTGPSGCGKSTLCDLAATAVGREIEPFNCGAMSEPRSTLIGNVHFDPQKGTWFGSSRFVRAIQRESTGIKLDEISRLQRDGFNILLPLLDGQSYLALDEQEEGAIVRLAAGVFFLATANMGAEYLGADQLDKALKDRFGVVIDLSFPPGAKEMAVLKRHCPGLGGAEAKRLVEIAGREREMAADGEFTELISTRALLSAGDQIANGISFEKAVTFCILNHFSTEGNEVSDRAKLAQIVQKGA